MRILLLYILATSTAQGKKYQDQFQPNIKFKSLRQTWLYLRFFIKYQSFWLGEALFRSRVRNMTQKELLFFCMYK